MNRRRDRAEGFTLIELLVTMMLLSIVSVILFSFIDNVTNTTTRASADVQAETDAQLLLRQMSEDIRAAQDISATYPGTPTCAASPDYSSPNFSGYKNCLSFSIYRPTSSSNLTCPRTDVVYGLNGTNLAMSRKEWKIVGGVCTATSTTTGLVQMKSVVNGATGQALFQYFDKTGKDMLPSSGTQVNPVGATTVKVTIVKRYRKNAQDLVLTTSAALRNQR